MLVSSSIFGSSTDGSPPVPPNRLPPPPRRCAFYVIFQYIRTSDAKTGPNGPISYTMTTSGFLHRLLASWDYFYSYHALATLNMLGDLRIWVSFVNSVMKMDNIAHFWGHYSVPTVALNRVIIAGVSIFWPF